MKCLLQTAASTCSINLYRSENLIPFEHHNILFHSNTGTAPVDSQGYTALEIAEAYEHHDCANLLREYMTMLPSTNTKVKKKKTRSKVRFAEEEEEEEENVEEWSVCETEDGYTYYYNNLSGESQWENPFEKQKVQIRSVSPIQAPPDGDVSQLISSDSSSTDEEEKQTSSLSSVPKTSLEEEDDASSSSSFTSSSEEPETPSQPSSQPVEVNKSGNRLNKFRPQSLNVSDIEKSYDSKKHAGQVPISPISPISPVSPINALDPDTMSKSEEYIKERREERRKRRERRMRRVRNNKG